MPAFLDRIAAGASSRLSIRWFFLLALFPGLLAGAFLLFTYLDEKRSDLELAALQTSRALAQSIDKDLEGIMGQLRVLATSPYLRSGNFEAFHGQAVEVAKAEKLVSAIALIDDTGQQVLNSVVAWGSPLPRTATPELLRVTLGSGRPAISDVHIGNVTGRSHVSIQIPVEVKGKRFGLTMAILTDRLTAALAELNLPRNWLAVLCDAKGRVIARSAKQAETVAKDSPPVLMERAAKANEGTFPGETLEGVPSLAAFKRSTLSGWIVLVALPRSAIYESLYGPLGLTALVVLLSLAGSALWAFVFGRHVRAWLRTLQLATKMAGSGDLDVAVPTTGPREIADLAKQFNEMQASRKHMRQVEGRLTRALLLLSESNMALLYADEEGKLLPEVCRLIVDRGGYLMAWVGLAEPDAQKTVRPVALSGAERDYLSSIRISWGDNELGRGPTGTAIRTGTTQINQNILTNPNMAPWLEAATRRGYQSSIALPLRVDGVVIGALTIYAAEADAFGPDEVGLLEKLTNNLAFGIERLRTRNQLAIANQELQGFTYAASHDMKAPLQRIVAFSSLLNRKYRDDLSEEGRTMLDFIWTNAVRMMALVEDLLDHSQIEQIAIVTQPVNVQDAVRAILEEKRDDLAEEGAEVQVVLPEVSVMANPLALSQVLRNLLSNALKYSSQAAPPTILVCGQRHGEVCRLWIQDNGVGFDMVYHDRIFEIFRRLHTYAEFPGSGVGLALVKKAMERMGGRVWAKSSPGQGATFYIELPVAKAGLADRAPDSAPPAAADTLSLAC